MKSKIGLGIIAVAVIALAIVMSGLLAIVSPFEFAGFQWTDMGSYSTGDCSQGGTDIKREGEFVVITAANAGRLMQTDVTGIDEILVIYEGNAAAYCGLGVSNSGAGIGAIVKGSVSGGVSAGQAIGTSRCPSSSDSVSAIFKPAIWKFRNNFDGTWSSLEGIGVGDIFIVKSTAAVAGNPHLQLEASASGQCGKGGTSLLKIYNIVRKENAFALCKADKYAYDANGDGKIATDGSECLDLKTIVLNSEEAIKESYDEKLARITAELEAKNSGLAEQIQQLQIQLVQQGTSSSQLQLKITQLESQLASATDKTAIQLQIDALRQQQLQSGSLQDQVSALQAELKETKIVLASVQANDQNVIAAIESQEQFKKPNIIQRFFNAIASFFADLF